MRPRRVPRRAEGGCTKFARSNLRCGRGRGMGFVTVLLPFEGGIAAAGAVDGRGGGRSSGRGVDAAGPPREVAGGGGTFGLGPSMEFLFWHAGVWFPPFARSRAAPGRWQPPARCGTGCGAAGRGWCGARSGQRRSRVSSGLFGRSRRAASAASIWRQSGSYDGVIVDFDAGSAGRGTGVVGAWTCASGLRREAARRLPRPRIRARVRTWCHVTSPYNIVGWLFHSLCVTMAPGLGVGRLGASGGRYVSFITGTKVIHLLKLCKKAKFIIYRP
jgi:hypothetical protein